MDSSIEEIKNKLDIVEFIGSFITLKKAGRNFKANCPFHQEKTPSFVVSPDRQIWHCFGSCGDGGDVIRFFMKWENITFHEALQELAKRVGVQLKQVNFEDKQWNQKEKIVKMNYLTKEFFQYVLHKTSYGTKAMEYLSKRNIHPKIIDTFEIGYAPASWDSLLQFLKKKGFKFEEMVESGLIIKNDYGKYYDRFRGRIMFPIKDPKGNIIGFSGRVLDSSDTGAKYVNTPETPVYHKRESLYGIHLTRDAIRKLDSVLIVEGEFDLIMPFQHGVENIVAIKGAALTHEQLSILKRYTKRLLFALDADEAGIEAIKRGVQEAEKMDFEIYAVEITGGKDPDEAVQKDPVQFKKSIESPRPIYDFLIDVIHKKYPTEDPFYKKKFGEEIVPYLTHIQNPIVISHYIKKLSMLLDVTPESIEKLLSNAKRFSRKMFFQPLKVKTTTANRDELIQKQILSTILQHEEPYAVGTEIFTIITPDDFSIPAYKKIASNFIDYKGKNTEKFDIKGFFQYLPNELRSIADEVYLYGSSDNELQQENITKLSRELKRFSIKHKMSSLLKDEIKLDNEEKNQQLTVLQEALKSVEKSLSTV